MWWAAAVLGWEYGPQAKRVIPGCSLISVSAFLSPAFTCLAPKLCTPAFFLQGLFQTVLTLAWASLLPPYAGSGLP